MSRLDSCAEYREPCASFNYSGFSSIFLFFLCLFSKGKEDQNKDFNFFFVAFTLLPLDIFPRTGLNEYLVLPRSLASRKISTWVLFTLFLINFSKFSWLFFLLLFILKLNLNYELQNFTIKNNKWANKWKQLQKGNYELNLNSFGMGKIIYRPIFECLQSNFLITFNFGVNLF